MNNLHQGYAPGKLILSGEHSVVYDQPAIAVPLSLGVHITLEGIEGPLSIPDLDPRLTQAWQLVLPSTGLKLSLEASLPIGCGLGSSAAISIATLRALASFQKREPSFAWLFEEGFTLERIFHGTPSGLDHAVCALEQSICYHKKERTFDPIVLPEMELVVIHSNEPKQTKKMVAKVRSNWPNNQAIIADIGQCTRTIIEQSDRKEIGRLLTINHQLLQTLGVSTPKLDHLVALSMEHGAYGAKLTGAGGGGIMFALVENSLSFLSTIKNLGYEGFAVHTGKTS